MSTVATPPVRQLAQDWESKCGLTSAICSGIVGDLSHKARGGYHISRADQPSDNYSVIRPDDKFGLSDAASGVDMTLSTADMKKCTQRLIDAYVNTVDPRRKYINAFNGWLGSGGAQRWDVYARKVTSASVDHKWHVHLSIRRRYTSSPVAMKAILSILKGETVAEYLTSIGVPIPSASAKAPAYPGRILRRNDKQASPDAAVKLFQAQMLRRGWESVGTADGFFGPNLESVVKRWQEYCKMAADGEIGPRTWPTPWTKAFATT